MKKKKLTPKKIILLTLLVFAIVGIALLILSFKNLLHSFEILFNSFMKNPVRILPIIVIFFLFMVGGSFSFYILTKFFKKDYKFSDSFVVFSSGAFISNITPFASGGQILQLFMLNAQGLKKRESFTILLIQFMIYQLTLTLITSTFFITSFKAISTLDANWVSTVGIIGLVINLMVTLFLFTATYSKSIYNVIINFIVKILLFLKRKKTAKKLQRKMTSVKEMFIENTSLINNKVGVLFFSFIGCFVWILSWIFLSHLSLEFLSYKNQSVGLPLWDSLPISSLVLSTNSFIPIPGAAGTTEVLYILSFGKSLTNYYGLDYDVAKSIATSASIVWRFWVFYMPILIGIICLVYSKNGIKKYLQKEN